ALRAGRGRARLTSAVRPPRPADRPHRPADGTPEAAGHKMRHPCRRGRTVRRGLLVHPLQGAPMPAEVAACAAVTVRVARSEDDRARVFALRARTRSGAVAPLSDAYDRLPNAMLLLAESRFDGEALVTLRILTGDRGPMMVDGLLELPASLKRQSIAEGSRLAVCDGPQEAQVRRMLWKAFHRYC